MTSLTSLTFLLLALNKECPSNLSVDKYFQGRALNYARQAAERVNNGLENYRAESAAYGNGTILSQQNEDGSISFVIRGHTLDDQDRFTIETITTVKVCPNDSVIVESNLIGK